jgi:hypothetical protein
MKQYIRNKIAFQTRRDRDEKIKASVLDIEFFNISLFLDSIIELTTKFKNGEIVGTQGYDNFLFKNLGDKIVLEKIDFAYANETFKQDENCIFVYNQNNPLTRILPLRKTLDIQVLKYKNNTFTFGRISSDDFRNSSIFGKQKIKQGSISISKIRNQIDYRNFVKFANLQIKKIEKQQNFNNNNFLKLIDPRSIFTLNFYKDYNDGSKFIKKWVDNNIAKGYSFGTNFTQIGDFFFGGRPSLTREQVEAIGLASSLIGMSTVNYWNACIPKDTVQKGHITEIICSSYRSQFFSKILPRTGGQEQYDIDSKAINNKDLFLSMMFFGEKQIENRHFIRVNEFSFSGVQDINTYLTFNTSVGSPIKRQEQCFIKTPSYLGPFAHTINHNIHIANNQIAPIHFADYSISITSGYTLYPTVEKKINLPLRVFSEEFLREIRYIP